MMSKHKEYTTKMRTIKTTLTIIAILWIAFFAPIPQTRRVIIPDLVIMPISLDEALDASLRTGDGRRVNWQSVRW